MARLFVLGIVNTLAGGAGIAALLAFGSAFWWGFSFLEHPRPQYCLILVIAVFVNVSVARSPVGKLWALGWSLILLLNLTLIMPILIGRSAQPSPVAPSLRLLHLTLDHDRSEVQPAIAFANTQSADLISLLEVTPDTLPQLVKGLTNYQLIKADPRSNSHGTAWFMTRQPRQPLQVKSAEVIHLPADSDRPLLQTTIESGGKTLELLCFHVIRPRSAATVAYQKVEFAALAEWSQRILKQDSHAIVIGDFNNTPWSLTFRQLLQASGLHNSQNGFGLQPTWHASLPHFLQIPIDHCLHSPKLVTRDRQVGANIGSDHLPILVDLQL